MLDRWLNPRLSLSIVLAGIIAISVAATLMVAAFAQIIPGQIKLQSFANPFGIGTQGPGPQSTYLLVSGGTFTCTSSGTITITNTNVDAGSAVWITLKTAGSPAALLIATITAGTGFTVTCGSGDTSIYNYVVIG